MAVVQPSGDATDGLGEPLNGKLCLDCKEEYALPDNILCEECWKYYS